MKKLVYIAVLLFVSGITFTSCVNTKSKNEAPAEEIQVEEVEATNEIDSVDVKSDIEATEETAKEVKEEVEKQVEELEDDSHNG